MKSPKGVDLDRRLREHGLQRPSMRSRRRSTPPRSGVRESMASPTIKTTVPIPDRQSRVPVGVHGVVPKLSLTPGQFWWGAPAVGEHTNNVLEQLLGLSNEEIRK